MILGDIRQYWKAAVLLLLYIAMVNLIFHRVCPMVIFTGLPCPGCGMTRALFLVLQLKFAQAWEMHPLVYGWIALGITFCVRRYVMCTETRSLQKYAVILLAAMVILYGYRMVTLFPNQEPMTYFHGNLLQKILGRMRSSQSLF